MAQATSYSMPRAGHETSFLSFDDVPNSPDSPQLGAASGTQYSSLGGDNGVFQQQTPASPDSAVKASSSNRTSPSKMSRLVKARASNFKDTFAAASPDPTDTANHSEQPQSSPSRASAKPGSSRGSRLGALLGRSMPSNDSSYSRHTNSSANHAEPSSNDSSFFGRRNRSKAAPLNQDIDEAAESSPAAPFSASSLLYSTDMQNHAARSASAMAMLDSSEVPAGYARRPSSQSNLLDTSGHSARDSVLGATSSSTTPAQTRGGRLGRLAYKKEDSIAFIAQSRQSSQQMSAGTHNASLDLTDRQQSWNDAPESSSYAVARGLGIEDAGSSQTGATSTRNDSRPYAQSHFSSYRQPPEHTEGLDHVNAPHNGVGVASTSARSQSIASSSNASSRAPSVAGTHPVDYHSRFSRQGLSQDLSNDPQARAARSSLEAHSAPAAVAASSRSSYETSAISTRGTLSDADIVALGAMPGTSAASLLNDNGAPLSSKNILTIALQKAQNAVQLDSANNVPDAIAAYKQAVRLLEEVMERIAPRSGKRSRPSREEERRRLRVIHDTYADRIRLLSMIYSPDNLDADDDTANTSFSSNAQPSTTKADWLDRVRDDSQEDPALSTPRYNGDALDPNMQHSPRDDARSFLSITPVRTAFPASATQSSNHSHVQQQPQTQQPWPRSPPMPSAPLSPSMDSSPRRRLRDAVRPGSRGSRGSRTSISLSIADEQEAQEYRVPPPAITEEMPRISVEANTPEVASQTAASPKKPSQPLPGMMMQTPTTLGPESLLQQHGRSDSDSSYQSTTTAARLKPTALSHRAFGLEDEVRTPVTPYFDATGDVEISEERASDGASPADSQMRQHKPTLSSSSKLRVDSTERLVERPAKMGLAQRARALSFKGPSLRQKASMPSLGDRKKDEVFAVPNGNEAPTNQSSRPDSADSAPTKPIPMLRTDSSGDHPTPWDLEPPGSNLTVRPAANRPRASTASALVSSTTSAGTISQRRKIAQSADKAMQEFEELGLSNDHLRPTSIAMSNRQRSTSQPGSRRPSIPAAFVNANASASGGALLAAVSGGISPNGESLPPPVPDLPKTIPAFERKPSVADTLGKGRGAEVSRGADSSGLSLAMPLPRSFVDEQPAATYDDNATQTFLVTDVFPSGLPSLAAGAPSYASTTAVSTSLRKSPISTAPHVLLRPFFIMTRLRTSILSGAQVTDRLYLPSALWRQGGVKLLSVESKTRVIELLLTGLETVEKGGEPLLMPLGSGAGLETSNASRFVKQLDEFEVLMGEVQSILAKKLPFIEAVLLSSNGGGGGKSKFGGGFGSRFTRGLDRMTGSVTQSKALDSPSILAYIDALARLFSRTSILSSHLTWLLTAEGIIAPPESVPNSAGLQSPTWVGTANANLTAYSALPPHIRQTIHGKLRRGSEFFGKVVLAFVLQDVGVLMEKWAKKGSGMFVD